MEKKTFSNVILKDNDKYNIKREVTINLEKFLKQNADDLPTSFENLEYYNKKEDGHYLNFLNNNNKLWKNENSVINRLHRFLDERYILIDTELAAQRLILICGIIIGIILIVDYFIEKYKKKYKIIEETTFMKRWREILLGTKLLSTITLIYYTVNNILIRTSAIRIDHK
jgi:hypothetical protein